MTVKRGEANAEPAHETVEAPSPSHVVGLPQNQQDADELYRQVRAASSAMVWLAVLVMLAVCYYAKLPIIVLLF